LAGRLPRAVEIKDDPGVSLSIPQPPDLLLVRERASEQIVEEEGAQGFDGGFGQRG
jgi:hypothetical protein